MNRRALCLLLVTLLIVCPISTARAAESRIIDVAQLTWKGADEPSVSLNEVVNAIQGNVSSNWSSFTKSQGDVRNSEVVFKHGLTLSNPIQLNSKMICERPDFTVFMSTVRNEVYQRLGIKEWKNRYLIVLTPPAGCVWMGRAIIGDFKSNNGLVFLHNNASSFVITHEIGHTLGLGHSNLLRCETGALDGQWSQTCRAIEYGGSIDVMSNVETDSPLSTYHQWRMGLIENGEVRQSWLNESIELTASDVYGGTRAIFLRDGNSTYWLEYRRPRIGMTYNPGLVIYRTDPPPSSFVETPNQSDRADAMQKKSVSEDIWMLNLDSYVYSSKGRADGSMTLPTSKSVTLHSGGISIEVTSGKSEEKILVNIKRKVDSTPPPVPQITPPSSWLGNAGIIEDDYEDGESAIAYFEAQIDGKVLQIPGKTRTGVNPTYLDPLNARRTIFIENIPEGSYFLSIRATDVWGNKSAWSTPVKVTIDRAAPIVKDEFVVSGVSSDSIQISMISTRDVGSNLCISQLVNQDGFVLQQSRLKLAPEFKFKKIGVFNSEIQVFDCLGNGVIGEFRAKTNYTPATNSSRTGMWIYSNLAEGALTCVGKCTASLSTSGKALVMMGEGDATIALTGKTVAKVAKSVTRSIRTGATVDVGSRNRIIRVTGSNFTLVGIATVELSVTNLRDTTQSSPKVDASLTEVIQQKMVRYGFNAEDFASGWTVFPMANGTTLEDPSLDLCSTTYKSEIGRQYRRQVTASKEGTPYIFLSTEVVKYKDKAAADAALAELQNNYNACVKNKGGVERDGTFVDYTFAPLPSSDATLVNENSRVLVRAQIGKGVTARQLLAFYQFKGEMFTGLYVVKAGETPISDAEVKRWFDAAEVIALRLDTKF